VTGTHRLPTRAEARAIRSAARHAARALAAMTPRQELDVAWDRIRAVLARSRQQAGDEIAGRAARALSAIADEADARTGGGGHGDHAA
jgi:hypothetical protein